MVRIAIFVSGNGSNCENLIRHFAQQEDISVALVVSNRSDAYALERARRLSVPTTIIGKQEFQNADATLSLLRSHDIDFIVLAGFLLMVPACLIKAYPRRIINLHPALLPKFGGKGMYGMHVHQAVKDAGEEVTGLTVHYVSDVCDEGEIIRQVSVPLLPTDGVADIARKEHELEVHHFPEIVESVVRSTFSL